MKMRLIINLSDKATRARFEKIAMEIVGVNDGEIWHDRATLELADDASPERVLAALKDAKFDARLDEAAQKTTVAIEGMTCHSCEITVERQFKKLPGVTKVRVNATKGVATIETVGGAPDMRALAAAVADDGYRVRAGSERTADGGRRTVTKRPSILELVALFGIVLLLGRLLEAAGFFSAASDLRIAGGIGFAAAALIGLVAGTSSCLAVSGGLMLSMAGKYHERHGDKKGIAKMTPVFAFLAGRIASYSILGGTIGALGHALTPSPLVTGGITLVAAFVMIVMGLDILGLAPARLKGMMPRMPKAIAHRLIDTDGKEHPAMPFLLGAATFFIPCGFTQALQIYALTAGGFVQGGAILGGFAIGTVPALLALGAASSALKGKAGSIFLKFSGAVVIVLGLWNIQNGLTVTGHPLAWPSFPVTADAASTDGPDPNVTVADGKQVITMRLTGTPPFYAPSDRYTVTAGMPVKLEINSVGMGCRSLFQIPQLGVALPLTGNRNTVEFTPQKLGEVTFSCAMGTYRGTFVIKPKS